MELQVYFQQFKVIFLLIIIHQIILDKMEILQMVNKMINEIIFNIFLMVIEHFKKLNIIYFIKEIKQNL